MSPSRARRKLTERIGYLRAQLARGGMPPKRAQFNREEIEVLEWALERLGLHDARYVEQKVHAVASRVLPVEERKAARRVFWRQNAEELVAALQRAAKVA